MRKPAFCKCQKSKAQFNCPTNQRPVVRKINTMLVNVSLKFQTRILQIHCYFLLKNVRIFCTAKGSHIYSTKNNSEFDNVVGIYLTN